MGRINPPFQTLVPSTVWERTKADERSVPRLPLATFISPEFSSGKMRWQLTCPKIEDYDSVKLNYASLPLPD